ncbi:hypothetical protein VKT23_010711 [Stygiomarasmius scandens]|uniref:F-box domain-containing protein n=1 Tax=Marasmiellus scandens TaxID=2682957 RepID=A0ABR1JDS3_9AGAR
MPHQLFSVSELVSIIIGQADKADQLQCALVCKSWSEIALDALWYEVTDFTAFANLLSPLRKKASSHKDFTSSYAFDPEPGFKRWSRFYSTYCIRVRHLRQRDSVFRDLTPLFHSISRIRSPGPILPNLRTIEWKGSHPMFVDLIILMHDGVRKCTLRELTGTEPVLDFALLTEAIQVQMPSLVKLRLDVFPDPELIPQLLELINALPSIQSVRLPAFENVSDIMTCLMKRPQLKSLGFYVSFHEVQTPGVSQMGPPKGGPLSLEKLQISASGFKVVSEFMADSIFACLNSVYISSNTIETPTSLRGIIKHFSIGCPQLSCLKLDYTEVVQDDISRIQITQGQPTNAALISFGDLENILDCKRMVDFTFCHPFATNMTDEDIGRIARAWPDLMYLELGQRPAIWRTGENVLKPSVWSVILLTMLCPSIKKIGLLLDTSPRGPPPSILELYRAAPVFAPLEELDVGISTLKIDDEILFTQSLAYNFVWPSCQITFEEDGLSDSSWMTVQKWFPVLSNMAFATRNKDHIIMSLETSLALAHRRIARLEEQQSSLVITAGSLGHASMHKNPPYNIIHKI